MGTRLKYSVTPNVNPDFMPWIINNVIWITYVILYWIKRGLCYKSRVGQDINIQTYMCSSVFLFLKCYLFMILFQICMKRKKRYRLENVLDKIEQKQTAHIDCVTVGYRNNITVCVSDIWFCLKHLMLFSWTIFKRIMKFHVHLFANTRLT